MIDKEVLEEKELAEITRRMIIYRFKIYSATTILHLALIVTSFAFTVIYIVPAFSSNVLVNIIVFACILCVAFGTAIFMGGVFKKSLESLSASMGIPQERRRRAHAIFSIAYSVPIILFYFVPPFLPGWYSYAWFLSLIVSNAIVYFFYERAMNKYIPDLELKIYFTWTLLAALSTPILAAAIVIAPNKAWAVASVLYFLTVALASLREVWSAERIL